MVLEPQSLWKMELVKRGNEKLLTPFRRRSWEGGSGALVDVWGAGWGPAFPQCCVNALTHPSLCQHGVGLL